MLALIEQLAQPELHLPDRLEIAAQLRQAFGRMEVPTQENSLAE